MRINIINKDHGFLTQVEIPVTRYETVDGEQQLIWCNHAGADEEVDESRGSRYFSFSRFLVCRKCEAWRFADDNDWHDAPFEGVHHER